MSKKRRLFSFYVFHGTFKKIKEIAEKEGRSISDVINEAIEEFIKNEKSL